MSVISKNQLLEAGAHFGHNTRRWNPKMKEYIFGERNGIYIIDLDKTVTKVEEAYKELFTIVQNNGRVIFVGTRKQTQDVIKEEATRAGQFYVDQRWLGGTLTNYKTIRRSIGRLFEIEKMEEEGVFEVLPKKEVLLIKKEKEKLDKFFNGIREMKAMPEAMVVVDPKSEHIAVKEARKLGIPIFGIVDTNCDPDEVDFVIPANDDAIRAVKLIVGTLANAVVEAQGGVPIEIEFVDEPVVEDRNRRSKDKFASRKPRRPYQDRQSSDKPQSERPQSDRPRYNKEERSEEKSEHPRATKAKVEKDNLEVKEEKPVKKVVKKEEPKAEVKEEVKVAKEAEVKTEVKEEKPKVAKAKKVEAPKTEEEAK